MANDSVFGAARASAILGGLLVRSLGVAAGIGLAIILAGSLFPG